MILCVCVCVRTRIFTCMYEGMCVNVCVCMNLLNIILIVYSFIH